MRVRKLSGRVVGGDLTASERRALDIEMRRTFADYDRKNTTEIDAIVLLLVHRHFDVDAETLKEVYNSFTSEMEALAERYELGDVDNPWLCTLLLKDMGVDIDAWRKERKK
jgi:hypothetical protein